MTNPTEILDKLGRYFQTKVDNLSGDEMAEGPFENADDAEFGDTWEAAAKVIDQRGGLRVRFEFGDTDPALTAAAQQREERAEAVARPHDGEPCPEGECNRGMCAGRPGACGGCCGCKGGCLDFRTEVPR